MLKDEVLNIVSAYDSQVGCEESQKEGFWEKMVKLMQIIPGSNDIVIGGDMNEHVGKVRTD